MTTRSQPVGRARLRRSVTTEHRTLTVLVRREYAVREVVPFEDTNFVSVADHVDDRTRDNTDIAAEGDLDHRTP